MYQDWNLIQQDTAAQAKIEEEQRLEREAKERLDAEAALDEDEDVPVVEKKKKKKKKHKSESSQSSGTDGDAAMAPVEKKKKKKKKKKKSVEEDADMDAAAAALEMADADAALAPAHPDAKVVETTPPDAVITQPPPAPAPVIDSQEESSQPTPDWPRPGQIIECVWTKGASLSDGDVDRCVVDSIRDPVPHKKRKAGVPEHLAYQCYAQLKSLIKLAGDTDQPYETVPESDPRPKHVHLKYKLDLADHGRTWRILPVSKKASQRESVGETFSAMSDLTNN
jgi:hypothetical protein